MSAVNTESIPPPHTNGVIEDGYDEDEKMKVRPADIDADMREMERRKRVESIMNSRLFREELERIIESQIKAGNNSAGLLQQISDMVGSKYSGINNHLFRSTSCAVPINDIRGVEAMGYAKGEKILRCKLAALFRLIDLYGWTQGIYNHVTARLSQQEEHFLVNPYGLLYSEVTASSLVKVDMQGNVIESGTTNFSVNVTGFQLHAAIYAARPDLKCIVHLHTPSVIAVSSLKDGLLPICQEAAVIGEISHHSYIGIPNEPEERDKIVRNLGPNNKVIFLTNHGALCCGGTIEETFFYAYNTVNACETQLKVLPLGKDNLVLLSDETRKSMYDSARKIPENISPPVSHVPSAAAATEKRWRIGGLEFEALMRMLDNAGFRTGYVYRQPLIKGELPRPRNDVEVPPAVSSLGYLLEEEELYKGQWKKAFGGKGSDRIRWLNSPNVYQKVEILETGTSDPKKITKWVDANNEEWVADGSPSHTSTPVKIENALQFVPKNTNPKEFKKLQQLIKENRRADKITSGPQSHILEGVSWEEAKKLQDANISGTSDQVILVGAASKGIIQREYQHNATVYKTPYAKNPFDAVTDEEIENYKKDITRKQRGDSYYDEDESDALSSSLPPSGKRQNTGITSETEDESLTHEMRVIQIETTTVPKASQAEVVLSDDKANRKLSKSQAATKAFIRDKYDFYSEELKKFIVRIWEVKKMRPILRTIGESMIRPVCASVCEKDYYSSPPSLSFPSRGGGNMNDAFKQIARELMSRFKQGSIFKQRSVRPAFLPVAQEAPEFHDVSFKSSSFDCSDTEITTLIELPQWQRGSRYSRGSLGSVHDFSSDPTTEDEEEDPTSPEKDYEKSSSFLSLSSYIGHEFENPEETNEMNSSTTKTNVSDDTSYDEITVISKQKNDDDAPKTEFDDVDEIDDFDDTSLSSALMQDEDEDGYDDGVADVEWNTYESLNDVDEDYFVHENNAAKPTMADECVTSFIEKAPLTIGARYKPELAVIYEESYISDSKCSLKSILEDSATIFAQPQSDLSDCIAIAAQPECERSDTPDTYVIEDDSSRADHLDDENGDDMWKSLEKCIACADTLLKHVKNAKIIDRNDSETFSLPMANYATSDVNGTGVDSDAHTISESSLISCLADSTEHLEGLKNDSCSLDANDESDERVLDSGILMEDVITYSSEDDYTDMKLHSEVVSTEIGAIVVPSDGRASSGSEEAEDAVWITQIEKIFDFDVDDYCLNTLFEQGIELATYHEDTEIFDQSVKEEVTDFGLVYDTKPSNQRFSVLDNDHSADSVIQNDECSFDSVIGSDDQSQHDQLINDEISPVLHTFRNGVESMSTCVADVDHEYLDSIRISIPVNKPDLDSNHTPENYINAGVTSNVPESVIAHCDDDTPPIPASIAIETETPSSSTSEHNVKSTVSHQSQANDQICELIEQPTVTVNPEVTESSPQKPDFDTYTEYENVSDIFDENFLNDTSINEAFSHDPAIEQNISCNDLTDVEKTPSHDEFNFDNNMNDDSSCICKGSDLIVAASDETAKSSIADISESIADFEEEGNSYKITTNDSIVKDSLREDDIRAPEADEYDRSVIKNADFSNVAVGDQTIITESAIKTFENVTHQEAESDGEIFLSQLLEYRVEWDEENNNRIFVDDSNFPENRDTVSDVEAADSDVVCELEASAESSENHDDVTVVEMAMHNSIESSGKISENESSPERSESVDLSEASDCDEVVENDDVASESLESVKSAENDDVVSESSESIESPKNDIVFESSESVELPENDDIVSESSESVELHENDGVVSKSSESVESFENGDVVSGPESVENDDSAVESSESIESSENDDVASKSAESVESFENDDVVSESSNSIESFENNHDVEVAENDEAVSESSESADQETEIMDDDVTSMDNDNILLPSKHVESSQCNDSFAAATIVENDSFPNLFEFFKVTENLDDEVAVNELVELAESPENSDDVAIIENNPIHESSESAESTDMIYDAVTVHNDVNCESSVIVELTDENNDGIVESNDIGIPDTVVRNIGDIPVQCDVIDEPPEMTDSAENTDDYVAIVENGVVCELSESYELIDTAESTTTIDDTVTVQNYLIDESSEIVESIQNGDGVTESEDIIPDLSPSVIENVDDILVQSDTIGQPSEMVNLVENSDKEDSIDENDICELPESDKLIENVDNVVTVQNKNVSDDPPPYVVESSGTIADVVKFTDIPTEDPSSSTIENINKMSIPDYTFDQSFEVTKSSENIQDLTELAKSTKNIQQLAETDQVFDASNELGNNAQESVVNSPVNNNDVVESDDIIIEDPSESMAVNVKNSSIENGAVVEPLECVEMPENIDEASSAENNVIFEFAKCVESTKNADEIAFLENNVIFESNMNTESTELLDNISNHLVAVDGGVILAPIAIEPIFVEVTDNEPIENIDMVEKDPIHNHSNLLGPSEKSDNIPTIELIENNDNSAVIENSLVPLQSTKSCIYATDSIDKNHPEFESAFVQNEHLVAVSNHSISYSISGDANTEICCLLGYLNEKKLIVKNIAAYKADLAISADTIDSNVRDVSDSAIANSSNEMLDENYFTISDASSSKPTEDGERESSSSSQIDQSFVTISEASIDKSDSPIPLTPEYKTKPRSSPEQRKTRNNLRTRVHITNRRSVKRTSPSQKKESTDEDDSSRRNNATGSSASNSAGDEKKPKLETLDVTEYSVKLKLHIEWDNKRSSSDSTSKSSSFDDSLNCSESTSEGKRDLNDKNNTNSAGAGTANVNHNHQPCYHHRFEQVTRLLTDFKNDYPKFVTYEYFSPKVKFQTTPKKKRTNKNAARKSLSLDSSPSGRYHRYCHISTRDFNNVDNKSTNGSKCTSSDAAVTPKRNVSSPIVKNVVNQTTNISKKQVNRKPFKSRNHINMNTSLKTSTPVLTAAQFVSQESIIESLTSNTLSPIVNSLEEFELIESLLSSCEK